MGIYIKDMKMPKSCWGCTLYSTVDCAISRREEVAGAFKNIRHPNCPLIEVKEPHGRLIDADELKYYGVHIGDEYEDRFHDYQRVDRSDIDNAPTVIEGSK